MDGLDFNEAEHQLLYGNNWPALYVQNVIEQNKNYDSWRMTDISIDNFEKPTLITSKSPEFRTKANGQYISHSDEYLERFEYDGELVTSHKKETIMADPRDPSVRVKGNLANVGFSYDEQGRITSVEDKSGARHVFIYEGEQLVKSEYLLRGTKYSTRYYYYENGLNVKTEIFNVNNEKEFTILFDYEYYEEG